MGLETTESKDDACLVDEIRLRRSEGAFGILYDRHTPALYRTVWRLLGSRAEAEDAVQDTWIRALERLDTWKTDRPFGAWIRGIGAHVAVDLVRRQSRFTDQLPDILAPRDSALERIDLQRAVAALPPGYRAVLVLFDVEGFTHEEIGALLGIAVGTSKGQLHKARRAVRNLLQRGEVNGL